MPLKIEKAYRYTIDQDHAEQLRMVCELARKQLHPQDVDPTQSADPPAAQISAEDVQNLDQFIDAILRA